MKKIYIVHDKVFDFDKKEFFVGGIQTYLFNLAEVLTKDGYDVSIIQIGSSEECIDFERINIRQFKVKNLNKIKFNEFIGTSDLVIWGSDINAIKLNCINLSIQHGIGFDYVFMESKLKKFMVEHGLSPIYKFLQRFKAIRSFRRSDYKVCVDYNYQNWYRTFSDRRDDDSICVIPNFSHSYDGASERDSYSRILFARRFIEKRGVKIFCDSAKTLLNKYENITISFAGDGPLLGYIEDVFSDENRVNIFKYDHQDSLKIHHQHDIAVVPTLGGEGTSLSLLEAMSTGCAVIATDVGGMTNIILDSHNGLLISPNERSLYLSIDKLLNDVELSKKLSNNAIATVNDSFSFDKWSTSWLEFVRFIFESNKNEANNLHIKKHSYS